MASICRARLLSDLSAQTACDKEATSSDGRLCAFHSRQCQALYRGYKKRNAELDSQAEPPYLVKSNVSVAALDFADLKEEAALREVHDYLFRRYNLLDRVIRARKLHHTHFFAIDNDYGHEKYLDKLQNQRFIMVKALERLGKRAAAVMYEQKQWFDWVKQCQEQEEKEMDKEAKKVKLESLLFQRHQREIDRYQRERMSRENQKRQEQYLDEVHAQRLSEMSIEDQDEWDPIQDVYGYERDNYVDLIKFFLMLQDQEQGSSGHESEGTQAGSTPDINASEKTQAESTPDINASEKTLSKSAKKRAKKANSEIKKMADPTSQSTEGRGANIIEMETRTEMRERLRKPIKFERTRGWYVQGSGPQYFDAYTPVIPNDEIEQLLDEVAEIKSFLFCRLLLSHTTLLPAALEADSIEEFLAKDEVTREHLRDLCLKLERPGLQDVRDACADFIRERDGVEDMEDADMSTDHVDDSEEERGIPEKYKIVQQHHGKMQAKYRTKREKAKEAKKSKERPFDSNKDGIVDFGEVTNENQYSQRRIRVKVCGRNMYNYRSERALTRSGWFHFSVIAKDSDLFSAIELCRNWNEFFELNILSLHHYFPAPKWTRFIGDLARQQLLTLGFVPYFHGDNAEKVTRYFQTGSRGMERRSHSIVEMRNFICGHIRRDDPVSLRFIQYLSMETWELRALVRDPTTGRILIQPPAEELWILREMSGYGRATKNKFNIIGEVGPVFFEQMDSVRAFHFGFQEYYDVYVWDANPGRSYFFLQKKLEEVLSRALRVRELKDMFAATRHILQTITREPDTERVRSIKPDEKVPSMLDALAKDAKAFTWSPTDGPEMKEMKENFLASYCYTEADELEDSILFPQETDNNMASKLFRPEANALEKLERGEIDARRFAADLDTDEELSDSDLDTDEEFSDDDLDTDEELSDSDEDYDRELSDAEIEALEGDGEWILQEEQEELDNTIEILSSRFKQNRTDYFLSVLRDPANAKDIPERIRSRPKDLISVCRAALRMRKEYDMTPGGMQADFMRYVERQKSKAFKESFHMADAEPGATSRYVEFKSMVDAMDTFIMKDGITTGPFELCQYMRMASQFREERRIVDDAFRAYASIALFFETEAFLGSKAGQPFKESKLFDQAKRAKQIPDRRTHLSNKSMPKSFWDDWAKLMKDNERVPGDSVEDIFPLEWRKAMRPVIMRMFRAGVICSGYGEGAAGIATANAEPGRQLDLYIDYASFIDHSKIVSRLTDPRPFDRDFLIKTVAGFQDQYPSAKFSVLRLWSSPHFYPLMLGVDTRQQFSFLDDRGRLWDPKFIPKDMPYSEWSIHEQLSLRLEPYRAKFGAQVVVAKDLVLVMGKDEGNLRRLSEAVTWAIQTRPWRLEVDFWRSFVNVEGEFLGGLDRRWLD